MHYLYNVLNAVHFTFKLCKSILFLLCSLSMANFGLFSVPSSTLIPLRCGSPCSWATVLTENLWKILREFLVI